MPRKRIIQEYTLYIPQSIEIDKLLAKHPPNPKLKRDKLVYILHLMTSINASKKDEDNNETHFYSLLLKNKFGNDYLKYLQYLIKHKIIKTDGKYSTVSHKSKGYAFTTPHLKSPLVETVITDKVTIKNVKEFVNLNSEIDFNILPIRDEKDKELFDFYFSENLTVEYEEALKFLEEEKRREIINVDFAYEAYLTSNKNKDLKKAYNKLKDPEIAFNRRLLTLLKFKNQQFITNFDRTSYRLHSPLTQLKKGLRKFLRYDKQKLVCIDIKNSQPYLSTILFSKEHFNKNKIGEKLKMYNDLDYKDSPIAHYYVSHNAPPKDVELFIKQVTSGKFYEEFITLLENEKLFPKNIEDKRGYAKEIVFKTFFSPNYHSKFVKEIAVFEKIYPNVHKTFSFLKSKKKYNTLACVLQRVESNLILEKICKKIHEKYPEAPILTIHDSITTTLEYRDQVKKIMHDILTNFVGYPPQLSIEVWE